MRVIKKQKLALRVQAAMRGVNSILSAAAFIGLTLAPVAVNAATLISQGYSTDSELAVGSIVSLKKNSSSNVEPATVSNISSILGVVINTNSSQLSISSAGSKEVQVATSGIEQVLVSDMNGNISTGDQITASPITGVGMKATDSTKVLGVAQESFPNSTASTQKYTDKNKAEHSAKIGQVAVQVNVAYYYKTPDKTLIPTAIQNIANALAGKTVTALPILISVGIFIVTLIVVVSIIYSMIQGSIISVGRNPMAQAAVYRNVLQLSVLVVVILGMAIMAIYLVLKGF